MSFIFVYTCICIYKYSPSILLAPTIKSRLLASSNFMAPRTGNHWTPAIHFNILIDLIIKFIRRFNMNLGAVALVRGTAGKRSFAYPCHVIN